MWFIFPQYKGLGLSETSQYYGIQNLEEAQRYLNHPILGERLKLITQALLAQPEKNVHTVFGDPDDLKLHSCMTLFAAVDTSQENVFDMALAIFFKGKMDEKTLEQISKAKGN